MGMSQLSHSEAAVMKSYIYITALTTHHCVWFLFSRRHLPYQGIIQYNMWQHAALHHSYRIVGTDDVIYDPPRVIIQKFALFMDSILQIDITNSTFENNIGTALGVNNSTLMLDGKSRFLGSCRNCLILSHQGGGLYASNSSSEGLHSHTTQ